MAKDIDFFEVYHKYLALKPDLERLETTVYSLIKTALQSEGIDALHVQTRVKSSDSIEGKIERKAYSNPIKQITDLVGARVILYLESDIRRAESAIRHMFEIDEENSVDKLDVESANSVGYRSLHLVASLGKSREQFPEYRGLTQIKFEVQIRTALQHAWAEIEHKQNYKSDESLPPKLQRRLFLLAGTLEQVDREFGEIVRAARDYERDLEAGHPDTRQDPLSTVAVRAIFSRIVKKAKIKRSVAHESYEYVDWDELVSLLKNFGLSTVGDLEDLVGQVDLSDLKAFVKFTQPATCDRIFKCLMLLRDSEKYFASLKEPEKMKIQERILDYYETHHPEVRVKELAKRYNVKISSPAAAKKPGSARTRPQKA